MDNKNIELMRELVNGKDNAVEYPIENLPTPLTLYPLTSMQIVKLQGIEKEGQKGLITIEQNVKGKKSRKQIKDDVEKQMQHIESEIDYGQMKTNIANTMFAAIGMSARIPEELVEELIGGLSNDIVKDMFRKVIEISKLTKKDLDLLADFQ
jgi:hypothetical protein